MRRILAVLFCLALCLPLASAYVVTANDTWDNAGISTLFSTVDLGILTTTNGTINAGPLSDLSGNGNDATNNGATYNATYETYSFDGVNDEILIPISTPIGLRWNFTAEIATNDNTQPTRDIIVQADAPGWMMIRQTIGTSLQIYIYEGAGNRILTSIPGFFAYNGIVKKIKIDFHGEASPQYVDIYVDDVFYSNVSGTGFINQTTTNDIKIAKGTYSGGFWDGTIKSFELSTPQGYKVKFPFINFEERPDTLLMDRAGYTRLAVNNGATEINYTLDNSSVNGHGYTVATAAGAPAGVGVQVTPAQDIWVEKVYAASGTVASVTVAGNTEAYSSGIATFDPPVKLSAGTTYFLVHNSVTTMIATAGVEANVTNGIINWSGDTGALGTQGRYYGIEEILYATSLSEDVGYFFDGSDNFDLDDETVNQWYNYANLTIEAAIKPDKLHSANTAIIGNLRWSSAANNIGGLYIASNNKFAFRLSDGVASCVIFSDAAHNKGQLYNVRGWWDGSTCYLSVDGVQQAGTGAFAGPINNLAPRDFYVGASWTGASNFFTGTVYGLNVSNDDGFFWELPFLQDDFDEIQNVTIGSSENGGYFNLSIADQNLTSSVNASLYQSIVSFNAENRVTGASITDFTVSEGSQSNTSTNPELRPNATQHTFTFNKSGYYDSTLTTNVTALTSSSRTFSEVYDHVMNISLNQLSGSGDTNNFTVDIYHNDGSGFHEKLSTTNGVIRANLTDGNYTVWVNSSQWVLVSEDVLLNSSVNWTNVSIDVYTENSVQINIYDEETEALITQNVTLEFITSTDTRNASTSNGTLFIENLEPANYTIRYSSDPGGVNDTVYNYRLAFITITNRTTQTRDLYLLDENASNFEYVSLIIIDQTGAPVEQYQVQLLKYFFSQNAYILVEEAQTDIDGTVRVQVQLYDEFYRQIIKNPGGTIVKTTEPATIKKQEVTIQINTDGETLEEWIRWKDITYTLSFNEATDNFRADYDAGSGLAAQVCYEVSLLDVTGSNVVNSTCSSSSSATLLVGVTNTSGANYVATLYAEDPDTGDMNPLQSITYQYDADVDTGLTGLLLQLMLVFLAFGVTWKTPRFSLIAVPLSLVIGRMLLLNTWPYEILFGLVLAGVIVAWGVKR